MSSDSRSAQDMDVVYHKKGGTNDPAFLSKCVFRVDTSRGEEAPGAPGGQRVTGAGGEVAQYSGCEVAL